MKIRHKEAMRQNNKRYTIRYVDKFNNATNGSAKVKATATTTATVLSQLRTIEPSHSTRPQNDITRKDCYIRQSIAKKQKRLVIQRNSTALSQRKHQFSHYAINKEVLADEADKEPENEATSENEDTSFGRKRNSFNEADEEALQLLQQRGKMLVLQAYNGKRLPYRLKQPLRQLPARESVKARKVLDNVQPTVTDHPSSTSGVPRELDHVADQARTAASSYNTIASYGQDAAERFKRIKNAQDLQQKAEARQLQQKRNNSSFTQRESTTIARTTTTNRNTTNQRMMTKRQADGERGKMYLRHQDIRLAEKDIFKANMASQDDQYLATQAVFNKKHSLQDTLLNRRRRKQALAQRQQELQQRSLWAKRMAFLKEERMKRVLISQMMKKDRNKSISRLAQRNGLPSLEWSLSSSSAYSEKRLIRLAKAVGRSLQHFLTSLASIGAMALVVIAFFAAFAALLFSPFGIFFSGQDGDNHSIAMAVAEINRDFNARLDEIESSVIADSIVYHRIPDDGERNGDGRFITNWTDIVAVFAVRTAGGNDTNSMDVLTIDATRIDLLKDIFNDMNTVTYKVETIHHLSEDEADTDRTERILHITITSKNYAEMPDLYNFTTAQLQALDEIMKPEYAQMLSELVGTYGNVSGGTIVITDSDLRSLLAKLPTDLSPQRQEVIATAFSLVGKVNYFWGGKSQSIGWDDRWGTPTKVTAAGSRTTGTIRPFGLDCSGFVDWVFINATGTNVGQGGGAASQYAHSAAITWQYALPGDLVFYPDLGHVGIICGKDDNGNLLVVHCASSQNNVVVTGLSGFTKIRRPVALGN